MMREQADLQADHHDGLHFAAPHPHCWCCWDQEDRDGDNPEVPDPFAELDEDGDESC